jgi:hypothetical protein
MTVCGHAGHVRHVDRLTIGRVNLYPQNHVHFTFPAHLTVTSARRSQAVARALCTLPAVPAGSFNCPADLGISYVLTFTAGDSKLAPVTVDAAGCQEVDGLGPVPGLSPARWTTRTMTSRPPQPSEPDSPTAGQHQRHDPPAGKDQTPEAASHHLKPNRQRSLGCQTVS